MKNIEKKKGGGGSKGEIFQLLGETNCQKRVKKKGAAAGEGDVQKKRKRETGWGKGGKVYSRSKKNGAGIKGGGGKREGSDLSKKRKGEKTLERQGKEKKGGKTSETLGKDHARPAAKAATTP